jgi:hypothetical protein
MYVHMYELIPGMLSQCCFSPKMTSLPIMPVSTVLDLVHLAVLVLS